MQLTTPVNYPPFCYPRTTTPMPTIPWTTTAPVNYPRTTTPMSTLPRQLPPSQLRFPWSTTPPPLQPDYPLTLLPPSQTGFLVSYPQAAIPFLPDIAIHVIIIDTRIGLDLISILYYVREISVIIVTHFLTREIYM